LSQSTKRWVIDDISNAALYDLTNGDPIAYFERLQKMTITIDAKQDRVYGGTSKYAFHLTEKDAESAIQIENAILDYNEVIAATGATATVGEREVPYFEKLTVGSDSTVTLTHKDKMISESEKVIVVTKGLANSGKQLKRVAAAATADEYSIAAGVITFGDDGLKGKDVRVFYDYTSAATAESLAITTKTKNKPYKFVAIGRAFDDELNEYFDVTIIVYKAQLLGTFTIDQQRKNATSNTLDLAVLDANRSDGMVIDIIAS